MRANSEVNSEAYMEDVLNFDILLKLIIARGCLQTFSKIVADQRTHFPFILFLYSSACVLLGLCVLKSMAG